MRLLESPQRSVIVTVVLRLLCRRVLGWSSAEIQTAVPEYVVMYGFHLSGSNRSQQCTLEKPQNSGSSGLCQEGFYPIVFLPDFLADTDTSILEILCRCVDIAPLRNPNRNSYRIAYQVPPGDERVGLPQQDFFLAGGMKLMLKLEFLPHYITLRGKPPAGPPPARAGSHLSSKLARPSPWPHARFRVGLTLFSLVEPQYGCLSVRTIACNSLRKLCEDGVFKILVSCGGYKDNSAKVRKLSAKFSDRFPALLLRCAGTASLRTVRQLL